jgi:hypothetical protein
MPRKKAKSTLPVVSGGSPEVRAAPPHPVQVIKPTRPGFSKSRRETWFAKVRGLLHWTIRFDRQETTNHDHDL